jgi:uncharacterized membrane protein
MDEKQVAEMLGWFSLGLGLAAIALPDGVARLAGVPDTGRTRAVLRAVGAREIAQGIGILGQDRPVGWLWSRVAGDVMDLTLTGSALTADRAQRERVAAALAGLLGITAADAWCSARFTRRSSTAARNGSEDQAMDVKQAITVNRPAAEIYQFWHDFRNLPRFMRHLESVETDGGKRSHWKAKAPAGTSVEWDAEIVEDRPNEVIAWRSLEGAMVDNAGSVRFVPAPADRGTEVHVEMRYDPPGGPAGAVVAKIFGEEPGKQVYDDLHAFKQVMETGEVTQSEATAKGGGPAQPPASVQRR